MQAPVVEEPSVPRFEDDVQSASAVAPGPDVAEPVQEEAVAQEAEPGHVEPESVAPESVAPESVAPEAVAPEAVAPEAVAPEAVAPEAVAPEAVAPEAVAPEAVAPEAVAPEAIAPPPAPPEPVDAVSHWAVATFSPGMADEEPVDPGVPHSRYEEVSMIDASTWSAEPDRAVVGYEQRAAAEVLESVAGRLRRGEILLAAGSSTDSEAAVVAAVLSVLLGANR
jgi:hypothetical protein